MNDDSKKGSDQLKDMKVADVATRNSNRSAIRSGHLINNSSSIPKEKTIPVKPTKSKDK